MNTDILEGRWRQMRGDLRSWWGKLTDDDLERIGGKKDRLIGVLQEKYGYTRETAQQEVDRRFREYEQRMGSTAGGPSNTLGARLEEVADEAGRSASEASSSAAGKASQPMSAVGEKIGSLADTIREKAPHEGTMGTAATAVAEKLGAAGSYLQEKKLEHMVDDLSSLIRRYPIPSLLIGLGIGYLLARGVRR
ncbi:MAG TPA: CsbD family protein [Alphaproteobacteria bacterium]|nr:CsbD family protein [Alphaproteobacteria bacterium]